MNTEVQTTSDEDIRALVQRLSRPTRTGGRVILRAPAHGWVGLLPGQRVRTTGLLAAANRSDLTVAVLRVRGEPEVLSAPSAVQKVAERLRSGLRGEIAWSNSWSCPFGLTSIGSSTSCARSSTCSRRFAGVASRRGHHVTFLSDASASRCRRDADSAAVHAVATNAIELFADVANTGHWLVATSQRPLKGHRYG